MSDIVRVVRPQRVLLCLDPNCHGEFYLPLDRGELEVCPNDREHPVAVYVPVEQAQQTCEWVLAAEESRQRKREI